MLHRITASRPSAPWPDYSEQGIGALARSMHTDQYRRSVLLAFRHGFGVAGQTAIGDPVDLSWARRFALWASYALGQPLPQGQPGTGRNAFAHESGIHADGALKDRQNYELYDDETLGPFPHDWFHPRLPGPRRPASTAAWPGSGTSWTASASPWRAGTKT